MADLATDREPDLRMSREEYRRWAEAQPKGRFERVDGAVVAMPPERAGHNDTKMLVWLALRQAVTAAGLPCHVYGDGMTVEVETATLNPTWCCIAGKDCRRMRSRCQSPWLWSRSCLRILGVST